MPPSIPVTKLSVNVNKIATLRNTRENGIPDVARLSAIALDAGAHGITVHPRPDQRHIRTDDVALIAAVVAPRARRRIQHRRQPPFHGPHRALRAHAADAGDVLVPDAREAFTSNHGWKPDRARRRGAGRARGRDSPPARARLPREPVRRSAARADAAGEEARRRSRGASTPSPTASRSSKGAPAPPSRATPRPRRRRRRPASGSTPVTISTSTISGYSWPRCIPSTRCRSATR